MSDETAVGGSSAEPTDESLHQLHLGYDRVRHLIEAVPVDTTTPINLDVGGVVQTILGTVPEVLEQREALAALGNFDLRHVDLLRDYALALGHIHNKYRVATGTPDTSLVRQLFSARERLHADARPLVLRGMLDGARVSALQSGNNHQGLAYDVIGLVELLLDRWSEVGDYVIPKREELEQTRLLGNRLLAYLGQREQGPGAHAELGLLRQQAFTLAITAYNEVRHAIGFVRRHLGDVDNITPSLYRRGRRAGSKGEEEPNDLETEVEAAAGLNQAVATAFGSALSDGPRPAPNAAGAPVGEPIVEVPVGFPGALPLEGE